MKTTAERNQTTSIYRCPNCFSDMNGKVECAACAHHISYCNDVLDLRLDSGLDTLLDVEAYGAEHGVTGKITDALANSYCAILEKEGLSPGGRVLEIACGSGLLTASILDSERFSELHCGDISSRFMDLLSNRVADVSTLTSLRKYLFDANSLPFVDESFNYVFGNSVLHHLANFEETISDSYRVLKPGGAAVYAEPLLNTQAFVSLAAGLIWRAADERAYTDFTARHIQALKILANRASQKLENLRNSRALLINIEDKFQFPSEFLVELGLGIGFSRVTFSQNPESFRLGDAVKKVVQRVLRQVALPVEPLEAFNSVFEALTEDYGNPLSAFTHPLFAQIAFIK